LFEDGKVIGKYPIAIGAPESPTIAGNFDIKSKDAAPVYHKKGKVIAPGPDNPVGVRYMPYVRFGRDEYAIHGTAWPSWVNLRAAVSLGCIRMLNNDVIQVFNRVDVGTPVVVTTN
jgi:lipoprotein-anchoring transpeptidase ErfK/SrfK